jgi:type I restriction enzyme, S subunit
VGSVFWSDDDFFPIDTVFYVVTELNLHYVYYNLQRQNFINNDAAVPGLSRNQAYLNPFVVPASDTLDAFGEFISPLLGQILNLTKKNANLRQTRDLLLPRLVGEKLKCRATNRRQVYNLYMRLCRYLQ